MKELKIGELVYSKKYGQGIVTNILDFDLYNVTIVHDGKYIPTFNRKELFAKGDRVVYKYCNNFFKYNPKDIRDFIGYAPHCKTNKMIISVYIPKANCNSYKYVYDVEHYIKPECHYEEPPMMDKEQMIDMLQFIGCPATALHEEDIKKDAMNESLERMRKVAEIQQLRKIGFSVPELKAMIAVLYE